MHAGEVRAAWPDVLATLSARGDLTAGQARWAMDEILSGAATPAQMAAFSVLLRSKGETAEEVDTLVEALLSAATPIEISHDGCDIVGTGGDRAGTVNVSTMSGIVAASAGARILKHGNRAASSRSGAADCLEALGVSLQVPPAAQSEVLAETGIVFLFAPYYHPSFRYAGPVRREVGIPTVFNMLGPLGNPARPRAMAFGVADPHMAPLVAGVLARRGVGGMVFHGNDGLDELTTTTTSQVWKLRDGQVIVDTLDASTLGLQRANPSDLVGGSADENAAIARGVFEGATGPVRDVVLLNASAALLAHEGLDERPVGEQIAERLPRVAAAIDSGAALRTLDSWVQVSQRLTPAS